MKKLISLLLVFSMMVTFAACGSEKQGENTTETTEKMTQQGEKENVVLHLGVPTAPPTLPILRMIEKKMLGDNVEIKLDIWDEPEKLIAMIQDGNHDICAFPLTVISKLYNKGMDVQLLNVNTWGVTYFLTTDPSFKSFADLKGKTVYVPLQSSPPDVLTQYFINQAGLEVGKDVNIVYASTSEIASLFAAGEAEYGTLIEPQVTRAMMGNKNLRVALSFEEEWQRVTGTDTMIPNAGIGTSKKFIEQNPELVTAFETAYEEALDWVKQNPEEAGTLAEEYLGLKAQLVAKAIPNMGLYYKNAMNSKDELDAFYHLLYEFNPEMIGGKAPDHGMYYEK